MAGVDRLLVISVDLQLWSHQLVHKQSAVAFDVSIFADRLRFGHSQWDDGRIGPAGALISIVGAIAMWAHWTWRWAARALETTPPDGYKWERKQLLGNM